MKILITGLALSRNLGAPAMALTLVSEIKKRFPLAQFTFAVSAMDVEQETKWADYYGINITTRDSITSYILNKMHIKGIYQYITGKSKLPQYKNQKNREYWLKVHDDYMKAFREADFVIGMFGISYVGDGVEKFLDGVTDYSSIYYANKHNKPYARFIQSFGPFDAFNIRYFAKKEFNQLPFVPARGKNSAAYCRSIIDDKSKVYDCPDIAVLLPLADEHWLKNYLQEKQLKVKEYVVLSPSAVIYNMKKSVRGSIGELHVESFILISKQLIRENQNILLLPHMYTDKKRDSDREVCYKVLSALNEEEKKKVTVVEEDIEAMQAKSLIANSKFSIVSRYHALVAAISTKTPVVTLGWNIKYQDLMEYYGLEDMAIDTRVHSPEELTSLVFNKLKYYENEENLDLYNIMQKRVIKKVNSAFDLLFNWFANEK